jgi:hypothetical protein
MIKKLALKIKKIISEISCVKFIDHDYSNISKSEYLYFGKYTSEEGDYENFKIRVSDHALPRHHGYYEYNANRVNWIFEVKRLLEDMGIEIPKSLTKEEKKIKAQEEEVTKKIQEENEKRQGSENDFFQAYKKWKKENPVKNAVVGLATFQKIYYGE